MFSKARMDINELQVQDQSPTYSAITISDSHLSHVDETAYLPEPPNNGSYAETQSFAYEEDTLFWNRIEALLQTSPTTSIFIDHHTPIHEVERSVRRPLSRHSKLAYIVVFQQNRVTFRMLMEHVTVLLYPNGSEMLRKFRKRHRKKNGSAPDGGERRRSPRNRPVELEAQELN